MNSKYLYLIDPGHGGLNPETGEYVTPGKRSPKFDDGSVLYEGVNNRDNSKRIVSALKEKGYNAELLIDTWKDISLKERVSLVNKKNKERECVLISIHSDAYGSGTKWTSPSGISVWTSIGQTESDNFASIVINELICYLEDDVKWRIDWTDGDSDKEAQFYILRHTDCTAILIEGGFHTNKEEARLMLTDEWKENLVSSVVSAVEIYEHTKS